MNMNVTQETACDAAPSLRGTAVETLNQIERIGSDVYALAKIMMQAGILPTPVDSIDKAATDAPPRDCSLAATLRDCSNEARIAGNQLEELMSTLERELL